MSEQPDKKVRGDWGEAVAQAFLEEKGLKFLDRNWRCRAGEIDLIMQDGQERVLVEVRLRRKTSYGAGLETVGWQKQQKLLRAAAWYQQEMDYWEDLRFDVVSIIAELGMAPEIEHIENAFGM